MGLQRMKFSSVLLLAVCAVTAPMGVAQTSVSEQVRLTEVSKKAVAEWRSSTSIGSGLGEWDLKYGAEYLELGNFNDADPYFKRSLASNARNAWTHYFHGLALLGLGRRSEASQEFELTREIDAALGARAFEQMGPAPVPARGRANAATPAAPERPGRPLPAQAGSLEWSGRVFSSNLGAATTGVLRIYLGEGNAITGTFHVEAPLAGDWSLIGTKDSTLCALRGASDDGRPVEIRGSCTEGRFEGGFDIRGERGDNGNLALEKGGRKEPARVTGSPAEEECNREFAVCYARANAGRGFDNNSMAGVNDCTFQKVQCLGRANARRKRSPGGNREF